MTTLLSSLCAFSSAKTASSDVFRDPSADVEKRISDLLPRLMLEEKITMLGGFESGFSAPGVPRLGIPEIRMADGPAGVRSGPATAFPAPIALGATWDPELIGRYGEALAEETLGKGKDCILGPCVGIGRFPLGGRNFESFGEDPWLNSRCAAAYIRGVQSLGVIAVVKHFACNDQEWKRNDYDVVVSERALREIHLPAFEAAIREAGSWALMAAYSSVGGHHCTENARLLTEILKQEWGFAGLAMSDWVSVYSADKAANAGLDLEMPKPIWFGDRLLKAVKEGRVSETTIDDKIRRHLRVRFLSGLFDRGPAKENEALIKNDAHRKLALEIASKSVTLLKNDGLLPLRKEGFKSVALIGPNAVVARTGGGGSSSVTPWVQTTPFDAMKRHAGKDTDIGLAAGCNIDPIVARAIPSSCLKTPDGSAQGLFGEYFDNSELSGELLFTKVDPVVDFNFHQEKPDPRITDASSYSMRWTGFLVPPKTQNYRLALTSDDGSRLYIDDKLVIDHWGQHSATQRIGDVFLEGGKSYRIRIEFNQIGGYASVQFGWQDPEVKEENTLFEDAVALARRSEVAVVFVGNTAHLEKEDADVEDFRMAGRQDELVDAVAEANPNTVVIVYGGVPVSMRSWVGKVKAVLAAYYPGQEGAEALAQIVWGELSPSGKLPFSYIQNREDSPAFSGYMNPDLKVRYDEGVFVGYRHYDAAGKTPLFPFGHGLSYTSFAYERLTIRQTGPRSWIALADIRNEGEREGDEVVQLYVEPPAGKVPRPPRELKGFVRVSLKPGESKRVAFPLETRAFEYFDEETHAWKYDAGNYNIVLGSSSRDLRLKASVQIE